MILNDDIFCAARSAPPDANCGCAELSACRVRRETPALRNNGNRKILGFTLVELLVAMSVSLILMLGILSSYLFLGKNFTRTLGASFGSEPTLESQGRRTLETFASDVQMSSSAVPVIPVFPIPSTDLELTLTVPRANGAMKTVTYYFNSAGSNLLKLGFTLPPQSLSRIDLENNVCTRLHSNLLNCSFTFYDKVGRPYTS
ncbi:MAG: hypothetical protein JWM32_71, partial [Verrucomicrobia bacterium]|nr:hypothetical protein [Verrucomicrobiota bacterium]